MLSFVKQCKWITDNRCLSLLLTLSFVLAAASTLAEAMQVKRAGFVGMRGKKSSSTLEGLLEDLYENDPDVFYDTHKRAGFVGMRGKKASLDPEATAAELYDIGNGNEAVYKRAGFVGMRGKKSQSDYQRYLRRPTLLDLMPRQVRAGFVGMRG